MVLPLMIMGGLMVAGGLSALTLPETLHQHLPQTLEEGELFGNSFSNGNRLTLFILLLIDKGKDFGYKQWLTCCPPRPNRREEHENDVAQR
jgi:hypothetical protein